MVSSERLAAEYVGFMIGEHATGRMQRLPAGGVPAAEALRRALLRSDTPDIFLTLGDRLVTIEVALTRALEMRGRTVVGPPGLVTARQVRRLCVAGRLHSAHKRGKTWYVDPDEIATMINSGRPRR